MRNRGHAWGILVAIRAVFLTTLGEVRLEGVSDPVLHRDLGGKRRELDGLVHPGRDPGGKLGVRRVIWDAHGRVLPCGSPRRRRRLGGPLTGPRWRPRSGQDSGIVPAPG